MKLYLITFLRIHLEYWWVYLLSIVVLFFNTIISIVTSVILYHAMPVTILAHIGTALVFTFISSILFILPNYQVGKKFYNLSKNWSIKLYTLLVQLIFSTVIFIFALIVLKIIIDEF